MVFCKEYTECKVEVEGVRLKQAREAVYLGVRLSENSGMESELEWRIGMAATAVGALRKPDFGNKKLSEEARLTVYNAVVAPTLVHGWGMSIEGEGQDETAGNGNESFEGSGGSYQIGLYEKWRNKESIKAGSSGDTGEEEERMVEKQSDGESW